MHSPRLPGLPRDTLDADQQAVFDAIAGGPRASGPRLFPLVDEAGCLTGPFNAMLLSPPVGDALQGVGAAIRYRSTLRPRGRELAILVVAAHWRSTFEWNAHVAVGRTVGITDADVAAIEAGTEVEATDAAERAVVAFTRSLVADSNVDDDLYANAKQLLGERQLFELTALVGYYATLALQLRVFAGER